MRKGKIIVVTTVASMFVGGISFPQPSNANGTSGARIVFVAPKLADQQTIQNLVDDLVAAGFIYIEIHRTFLGRARFVAYSETELREVVINPTTGEVLRVLKQASNGTLPEQANASALAARNGGNGNSGNGNGNSGNGNSGNGNSGNGGNGNGNSGNGNN